MLDKEYVLSKVGFLAELSAADLKELAEDFRVETYGKDAEIMTQGHPQRCFYVVAEGNADAFVEKEGHTSWKVNSFGPGDSFGDVSLFTGKPANITVRCAADCAMLVLDAEHFARMLLRWPNLYQGFIAKLSHSLERSNDIIWEARHREFLRAALQITKFKDKFYGLWGGVRTTREIEAKIEKLARHRQHALVSGERGTGRQMFAWCLHQRCFGETAPFIAVDGRRFDQQWGEQALIGPQVAISDFHSSSLLDIAAGGTLCIQDINLLSPRAQLKLAETLHDGQAQCLVVGTMEAEAGEAEHQLIPELRACLSKSYIIPPLRDRKRDIPVLAQGVLEQLARRHGRTTPTLDPEATKLLLSHNYRKGNVTELIQVLERAFFLAQNNLISLEHIFFGPPAEKIGRSINLLAWPRLAHSLREGNLVHRAQQLSTLLFVAIILLLAMMPDTPAGMRVFILVWGLWWPALTIISPFLGRVWCTICPFAYLMDLAQRKWHLNRPVPDFLKKYDYLLTTALFLLIMWIEVVSGMRSSTWGTVLLLLAIQGAAVLAGVVFARHMWCRHLCPLGAFVGMASIGAALEVRADATVCLNHCSTHDCYVGSKQASGCPMSQHLPYLDNNLGCKLCFNCVRNCPNGAVQFNVRIPAREVWHLVRVNQGFVIFIAAVLAILIPLDYFEPLAGVWPLGQWQLWFTLAYWVVAISAGLLAWLVVRPFKTKAASQRVKLMFAAIPLVLGGHIIYQLNFLPGFDSLLVGLGMRTPSGLVDGIYVPVREIAIAVAMLIGLLLSGAAIVMVILHSKDHRANSSSGLGPVSSGFKQAGQ